LRSTIDPLYKGFCPVCGGDAYSGELELHGSCSRCARGASTLSVFRDALAWGLEDFSEFFRVVTGGLGLWGAQRTWAKRLIYGENTVLIAPTGMGKTTLLIAYSIYAARKGKRVVYIAPTRALLTQIYEKLVKAASRAGLDESQVLVYDSSKSRKRREEVLSRIKQGDYRVLVLTNSFLSKNHELLSFNRPDVVVADDVDSVVRSEKNIARLLRILGYTDEVIELAKKRLTLIWKLLVNKAFNNGEKYSEIVKEYLEVDAELEKRLAEIPRSQFIVASATGRMKGLMSRVLKELLRIDISGITIYGRDVTDSYLLVEPQELGERLTEIVGRLGKGGIIYIAPRHPFKEELRKGVEKAIQELAEKGLRVGDANPSNVSRLIRGELDVLVGSASYYGSSVRGIDAPEVIKYVVFVGTPVFTVGVDALLANPNMMVRTLLELVNMGQGTEARSKAIELRRIIYTLSPGELRLIKLALSGKIPEDALKASEKLSSRYPEIKRYYQEITEQVKRILDEKLVVNMGTITLVKVGGNYNALIPDLMTYIQASGRTSRLYGLRMTHGLSVILEYSILSNTVTGLEMKLRSVSRELGFQDFKSISLDSEIGRLKSSRESSGSSDALSYRSILVVVESPTKAKTIARFFGKPIARRLGNTVVYEIPVKIGGEIVHLNIMPTRGHIFDLTTNPEGYYGVVIQDNRVSPVYETIKRCQICGTQFTSGDKCPRCGSSMFTDSKTTIAALRKIAGEVDEVYIATDPDIEGEKIAYDVYLAVKYYNENIWRIELHEITVQEFLKALENKRSINRRLVEAEMYRRVLDRLVGFKLSQELQSMHGLRYLGAGRVQTPTLGLVIERYNEYNRGKCKRVTLRLGAPFNTTVSLLLDKGSGIIDDLKAARKLRVVRTRSEEVTVAPKPPYTTDELLADAARIGLPTELAMRIAQQLFEAGLITYHRTDSHHVSSTGIGVAMKYIEGKGLSSIANPSHWGNPGTHEAIRPVYPYDIDDLLKAVAEGLVNVVIPLTGLHLRLYDLIFKRFITSQLKPFKAVKSTYAILLGEVKLGEIEVFTDIVENGFNLFKEAKVYRDLQGIEAVDVDLEEVSVRDSSRTPLYTEGELVSLMKKLGLGRPSTYSKIIESVKRHGYVIVSKKRLKLIPTKRGIEVYKYLSNTYPDLISVETSRRLEESIDRIVRGEVSALELINDVWSRLSIPRGTMAGEAASISS